jgi:hypothetical protein
MLPIFSTAAFADEAMQQAKLELHRVEFHKTDELRSFVADPPGNSNENPDFKILFDSVGLNPRAIGVISRSEFVASLQRP